MVKSASPIIQGRYDIMGPYWNHETLGSLDILMLQAALMNVMAMISWAVCRIFGDATLLSEVRREVEEAVGFSAGQDGTIDAAKLMERCSLLYSTWQECLRFYTVSPSPRYVVEDTILDNGILLRKDSIVQILGGVMHYSDDLWQDAQSFDPRRFLKMDGKQRSKNRAFAPFGGGLAWCPGRHFVTAQAIGFLGALVLAFDVTSPQELRERGAAPTPVIPATNKPSMMESVRPPAQKPVVELARRKDWLGWKVKILAGNSDSFDWGL
jgi:cytochrome P450